MNNWCFKNFYELPYDDSLGIETRTNVDGLLVSCIRCVFTATSRDNGIDSSKNIMQKNMIVFVPCT